MSKRSGGVADVGEKRLALHLVQTGTGGGTVVDIHGYSVVALHVDATAAFDGTPQVKMKASANWKTVGARGPDGSYNTSITDATLAYEIAVFGWEQFRWDLTSNSGTVNAWAGLST